MTRPDFWQPGAQWVTECGILGTRSSVRIPAALVVRLDDRTLASLDGKSGGRVGRPSRRSLFHFDLWRLRKLVLLLSVTTSDAYSIIRYGGP